MKCPKCGNEAPQGSTFCNQCGTRLNTLIQCPSCGSMIPANSVFCPKCGKMVRNDMEEETVTRSTAGPAPITFNDQRRQEELEQRRREQDLQEQRRRRELEEQRQREYEIRRQREEAERQRANTWSDEEEYDDDETPTGHYNRNLIIGIIALAAIIGGLLLLRSCNNSSSDNEENSKADSTLVADLNGQDPLAVMAGELSRNNMLGDGASPAAAVLVPGNGNDVPDRIWGVTYLSSATDRSFIKIYQLTRSGTSWNPDNVHTKYLPQTAITLDNNNMIADIKQVPRAVKVDNKECLFFAYMKPMGAEGSQGRVSLNVFDMNAQKLTSLDYVGTIKTRTDGRQYIYATALDPINSPERKFLQDEAKKNIKILYFQTEEELQAEKEEREREEQEKAMASPDSADAKWNKDNEDKMEQLKNGEEVSMKSATYDKPIFNMKDMNKKVENENYIVFSDKSGSVYGFNKDTRKYFTIYSPKGKASGPTDIGFGDSKNNILRLRAADGAHLSYNLVTGKTKVID